MREPDEYVGQLVRNMIDAGIVSSVHADGSVTIEVEDDAEMIALLAGAAKLAVQQINQSADPH